MKSTAHPEALREQRKHKRVNIELELLSVQLECFLCTEYLAFHFCPISFQCCHWIFNNHLLTTPEWIFKSCTPHFSSYTNESLHAECYALYIMSFPISTYESIQTRDYKCSICYRQYGTLKANLCLSNSIIPTYVMHLLAHVLVSPQLRFSLLPHLLFSNRRTSARRQTRLTLTGLPQL